MKYILLLLSALTSCLDSLKVKNGIAYEASEGLVLAKDSINYDKLFQRLARSEADFMLTIKSVKIEPTIKHSDNILLIQRPTYEIKTVNITTSAPAIKKVKTDIKEVVLSNEPKLDEAVRAEIKPIKPIIIKDTVLPLIKPAMDTIWTKVETGDTEFQEMETTKKTKRRKKFLFFKNKE
ncbi:MAG: hypothetical protein J7604_08155 [Sporocytophaga sp.]|uniref:hypothetical protein n=1 Tax=Sporocytophaga sp. TaxID=2231183 RepID=UPI001B2C696B|nr:hypothetical protein [Sporocytophaga sp.]MBO9700171.1 hypothetical protein [Sporocytophaga sp.]